MVNTQALPPGPPDNPDVITPGSTYDGTFDTTNPIAWGFDKGGFLYRDQETNNAIFDPASLAGGTGTGNTTVPPATAPIRYAPAAKSYGFEQNSLGEGRLNNRPAVIDQPFGAGRVFLFAGDPFFRAWNESVERQALNALLYPMGAVIPADAPPAGTTPAPTVDTGAEARSEAKQEYREALAPTGEAIPAKELPKLVDRPVAHDDRTGRDVRITVHRFDAKALRRAVSRAPLSRSVKKQVRYITRRGSVTLVIKGVRARLDQHERQQMVSPIMRDLKRNKVKPLVAQL
jgi:hypothetical protein